MATAAALAASYLTCRAIVESRDRRVMRAIRDAESRTRFLGYPVESYQTLAVRLFRHHRRHRRRRAGELRENLPHGRLSRDMALLPGGAFGANCSHDLRQSARQNRRATRSEEHTSELQSHSF